MTWGIFSDCFLHSKLKTGSCRSFIHSFIHSFRHSFFTLLVTLFYTDKLGIHSFTMRIGNLIMAASAAGLVHAHPTREMKKRGSGFTCMLYFVCPATTKPNR
jgi:hypothetical protein